MKNKNVQLLAATELLVLNSSFLAPRAYELRILSPIWDEEGGFFGTAVSTIDEEGNLSPFKAFGHGASEFQSLAFAFRNLRNKFHQKFDTTDRLAFGDSDITYSPNDFAAALLSDNRESVMRSEEKLLNEIASEEMVAIKRGSSTHAPINLHLAIAQPSEVGKNFACSLQLRAEESYTVESGDSFRALTNAFRCLNNLFLDTFDESWIFQTPENSEDSYEGILRIYFANPNLSANIGPTL